MSAEKVIIPDAFAARIDETTLNELRSSGAVSVNPLAFDKLELPEVGYGDHVLGTLTEQECEIFAAYYEAMQETEDIGRELGANFFAGAAEAIRNKTEKDYQADVPDETAARAFRVQRRMEYLKALFYYTLCERFNCHEYVVGVRKGRKFIKRGKKHEQGD